ncbi:Exopolyphosphatase [Lachnellula suecica]|uniref:Exopolyphosphatase n=1 Tax=Lachnellula suecica TaxID=602035 RepID=A0A8T9CDH6_9HELO|nr:Exopolyphosphatase [Lachnellula suecica]
MAAFNAVLLAYLRTYASKSTTFYIPLSNIPRADLALRPELTPVLSRANLKPQDLITLSELPGRLNSRWILVDHNALQGELGKQYSSSVIGVVDHHDEEEKVPLDCGQEPRIIEKAGSCASLVVKYCKEAWDELSERDSTGDKELAALAMGPVLVDTQNLTFESKTTEIDREAVRYLEGMGVEREEYLKDISRAKEDIGGLSLEDILRKDYKQWTETSTLGVSSSVKDLSFLIEKAGNEKKFFDALRKFAEERELDICSIMTTSHPEGVFKRELLVWALNEKSVKAAKSFEAHSTEKLGLTTWKEGALDVDNQSQWTKSWWQERVENSRKQVAPLLRTAINE